MREVSLRNRNTFGLDVTAREYHEYDSVEALRALISRGVTKGKHLHVGGGSNLLFLEPRYEGVILKSAIKGMKLSGGPGDEALLEVGAGENWDDVVQWAVNKGLSGVENLSGIPGQAGAAAVQNIGAYGSEIKDVLQGVKAVSALDGSIRTFTLDECAYAYRDSFFKSTEGRQFFITHVFLALRKNPCLNVSYKGLREKMSMLPGPDDVSKVRSCVLALRNEKLPDYHITGNAGSFFKNPVMDVREYERLKALLGQVPAYFLPDTDQVKVPAAFLIEKAGWKGRSLGPAGVHDRQPLVLVNLGGACGRDIERLSQAVQKDVMDLFGVAIFPEVNFIS